MAGAPCPVEVMKRVVDEMHASEMTIAYGMTETSPVSTVTLRTDDLDTRCSTVGTALPNVEVKIVDPDTGETVGVGEKGELCSKGYLVMPGYWEDDAGDRRRRSTPTGWMHTGDLAVMDDDGYCNIVGRAKDMLIRGGENIYPREIEEVLFQHPAIAGVQVFGVPDKKMGEEVAAWISLRDGADDADDDELRTFCRERLAHFKVPRYWKFVDRVPDDGHRQGAEVQDARHRRRRTRPPGRRRDRHRLTFGFVEVRNVVVEGHPNHSGRRIRALTGNLSHRMGW